MSSSRSETSDVRRQTSDTDRRGRLVVVAGPSGAGKSTIVRRLLTRRPFRFSVSVTTRQPRPGEVDGVHYHFVGVERFRQMVDDSELLEWAEYGSNLYGTPRGPVLAELDAGDDVLLEIEIQGARQVRATYPAATMIFIRPPSVEELERRLQGRGDTDPEDIRRRLEIARREMAEAPGLFDHIVVNDDVDRAVDEIVGLLTPR